LRVGVILKKNFGNAESVKEVTAKLPKRVKRKRQVKAEDGTDAGWEEYFDYIFPDEENKNNNLKILEMAKNWKKRKATTEGEE